MDYHLLTGRIFHRILNMDVGRCATVETLQRFGYEIGSQGQIKYFNWLQIVIMLYRTIGGQ